MPSPLSHSTLGTLIKKLLLSIDSYNSSDLDIEDPDNLDRDSLGERARLCINFALHKIYSFIKDSKFMEAHPKTSLSSVSGQDYIDLDTASEIDDIESITDTSQNIKLTKKSWSWYRKTVPDPSEATGVPSVYIRRGNRIYLTPRPTSAVQYTIDFKKYIGDLTLKADMPVIPTTYDVWIIDEAKVFWFGMEDPQAVPALIISERNDTRQTALESILTSYDRALQAGSNLEGYESGSLPYESPAE